jgi:hypothetical protein
VEAVPRCALPRVSRQVFRRLEYRL